MYTTEQLNSALAGRYTIERLVGEGGMATVYVARDVKHNRKVALKVLKPDLGAIVGVERFLSEIEVTANLQHPNLLPLFDSGAADGLLFYVMPYVEGESLRTRLEREKQLPIDEAVRIATAVASALDYAHRRGVIHRDLKPENILLHEGQPLVADFGIALALSNAGRDRVTQTGLSLGTPRYMSPEQATGDRAIDARTDIYSLGAVTYEMLTGDPPHTGSSSQAIIARVLTERPRSIRSSRPNVPEHVEATVEQALEKLAADRFGSPREFSDALSGKVPVATRATSAAQVAGARSPGTRRERALLGALGIVTVLWAITGVWLWRRPAAVSEAPEVRFDIATPPSSGALQVSVSPNGRLVTFSVVRPDGTSQVWSRPLESSEAGPLNGTEGAGSVFWSPDSRQAGFIADGRMKRVPAVGGTPESICNVPGQTRGASWSSKNMIAFSMDGEIYRVSAAGGLPVKVSIAADGASRWEHPSFLPDGVHFLVLAREGTKAGRGIYVASLAGDAPVRLAAGDTRVAFAAPGHLLQVRDGSLYAHALDLQDWKLTGEPVWIADNVGTNLSNGAAGFNVSATGVLVTRGIGTGGLGQLQWMGRDGKPLSKVGEPLPMFEVALSRDGKRIAFVARTGEAAQFRDIWTIDLESNITSRLTADPVGVIGMLWSPDSRGLTFNTATGVTATRLRTKAVGGAVDSMIYESKERRFFAEDWSEDGKTLLIRRADTLYALPMTSDRTPVVLAGIKGIDEVRFAPGVQQVSYGSNESGTWEVYVANYPSLDNRRQVSASGGRQARWKQDGKELYFLSSDGKVMIAARRPGSAGEFAAPEVLFESPLSLPSPALDQWDVDASGRRFLFLVPESGEGVAYPLTVVLNWTNALKKN